MDIIADTKIIFIDIDGTLTNSNKEVSDKTKEVIKQIEEKGIKVILCTGRWNLYAAQKSKEISATPITISNSGNLVFNYETNEIIYINEILKEHLVDVFNYCNEHNFDCAMNGIMKRFVNTNSIREGQVITNVSEVDEPISELNIKMNSLDEAIAFKAYIDSDQYLGRGFMSESIINYDPNSDNYEFDVFVKGAGKGDGIKALLAKLNIPVSQTMCFGDYINDYSMFQECDIKVAMDNGTEKLKQLADYVTLTNDTDGVAAFLEETLL